MAREILFKAKRIDNGEWVEGYYLYSKVVNRHMIFSDEFSVEVDEESVCLYTGMEASWSAFENEPQECGVWEHDLLKVLYEGKKIVVEVKYECGMFILVSNEFSDGYIPLFDVVEWEDEPYVSGEVIGNIFDNPELLEGGA